MKKTFARLPIVTGCLLFSFMPFASFGQIAPELVVEEEITELPEEEPLNIDDMFEDVEDVDPVITAPVENKEADKSRGIVFSGSIDTKVGAYVWYSPNAAKPFEPGPEASFSSTLSFTCRPTDNFTVKSSILVSFPTMEMGIYELYFDYLLWGSAYLQVGKKKVSWGNSFIFDTDILDDQSEKAIDPLEILNDKQKKVDDTNFVVSFVWPFRYGNISGVASYKDYKETKEPSSDDLFFAASLEGIIGPVAVDLIGRSWAKNDNYAMDPLWGIQLTGTLLDFHAYAQYLMHINEEDGEWNISRNKLTVGLTNYWQEIGFAISVEYQGIYDILREKKTYYQYIAAEMAWAHVFDSVFSPGIKYFHDFVENYGTIIPGVYISGFLPSATFKIAFPIYYGTPEKQKYGAVIELSLNVNY